MQSSLIQGEGISEGVCSAPITEIADKSDVDTIDRHRLANRIQVEECLRRVLARAIPRIYNRDGRKFTREACCPLFRMPQHDGVGIPAHHPYRIGKCLSFCYRACLDTSYRENFRRDGPLPPQTTSLYGCSVRRREGQGFFLRADLSDSPRKKNARPERLTGRYTRDPYP